MKKFTVRIVCLIILSAMLVTGASAAGLENFQKTAAYTGVFTDVPSDSWYYKNVADAYEYGLMRGVSDNQFGPGENVRLSEAVAMAARLHCKYQTGQDSFTQGTPWYQTYVDYAVSNGIIIEGQYADFSAFATRAQFAQIFASAVPDEALAGINTIMDGKIPDVASDAVYIYKLFRAGVMTGKTESGMFYPGDNIQRSEAAAVVTRMASPSLRVAFTIKDNLAELRDNVKAAKESMAEAAKSLDKARTYFVAGISLSSGFLDAMVKLLESSIQSTRDCTTSINKAVELCGDKPELKDIKDKLEAAGESCALATDYIVAIGKLKGASNWSACEQYLELCSSKLDEVIKILG
jgi:hypothetical protein